MKKFPEDFYWGAATASYQVEGWNENTDWAQAARKGIVPTAGRLADHYHRYEEDFDIAKELGHNAHRLSIEWARIEPREGEWDEAEIQHYRQVLKALRQRGIEPFITIWHFTLPIWFAKRGGFESSDAPEIYTRYALKVVESFGDLCTHFATINEPNILSGLGWLRGAWAPFKRWSLVSLIRKIATQHRSSESLASESLWAPFVWYKVVRHLNRAHQLAYTEIKKVHPQSIISIVHQVHVYRANWNPFNKVAAWVAHTILNSLYTKNFAYCDEIGLNYYHYDKFGDKKIYPRTDMGWNSNPEHIYDALMYLARFKKPIVISEAGIADRDDDMRAEYITKQVEGMQRAYSEGVDIRGHMYWSLIDNYEWDLGIGQRFGLVEINYHTLERTIRPSAWRYKEIIEQSGL